MLLVWKLGKVIEEEFNQKLIGIRGLDAGVLLLPDFKEVLERSRIFLF